jgi:hypothetical protein
MFPSRRPVLAPFTGEPGPAARVRNSSRRLRPRGSDSAGPVPAQVQDSHVVQQSPEGGGRLRRAPHQGIDESLGFQVGVPGRQAKQSPLGTDRRQTRPAMGKG